MDRRGRLTKREQALRHNAVDSFYAGAADKPPQSQVPVPKERKRAPRIGPSEHQEQVAVVQWWDAACRGYDLPNFALFAVPNGGARDAITGARLKAEGVRRGALDLILAVPADQFHGLYLEMKVGDNKPTDAQTDFIRHLQKHGYQAGVHWTADSAIAAIKEYLA